MGIPALFARFRPAVNKPARRIGIVAVLLAGLL
jgi:hypothetical protein